MQPPQRTQRGSPSPHVLGVGGGLTERNLEPSRERWLAKNPATRAPKGVSSISPAIPITAAPTRAASWSWAWWRTRSGHCSRGERHLWAGIWAASGLKLGLNEAEGANSIPLPLYVSRGTGQDLPPAACPPRRGWARGRRRPGCSLPSRSKCSALPRARRRPAPWWPKQNWARRSRGRGSLRGRGPGRFWH